MPGWVIPAQLHFVPVDFNKESLTSALRRSSYDLQLLTFFSWLGVTYYLARETRNPERNVGLAVTLSALLAGLFFVAITYFMVLGIGDDTRALGDSSAPFIVMTERAGLTVA